MIEKTSTLLRESDIFYIEQNIKHSRECVDGMLVKHREWITVEKVVVKGCNKCGKRLGGPSMSKIQSLNINFPWGSTFENTSWQFELCDECIKELVVSFVGVPQGFGGRYHGDGIMENIGQEQQKHGSTCAQRCCTRCRYGITAITRPMQHGQRRTQSDNWLTLKRPTKHGPSVSRCMVSLQPGMLNWLRRRRKLSRFALLKSSKRRLYIVSFSKWLLLSCLGNTGAALL